MIGIYKLTSPSNKVYIGQSLNIKNRLSKYKNDWCFAQPAIHNAIQKYGWDNFKIDVLWSSEDNTNAKFILNELEQDFIALYNCISPNGYNLRNGGDSKGVADETRLKLSIASTGHKLTDESKAKMSDKATGRVYVVSDETKAKLKLTVNGKISIIQLDRDDNFIKEWDSAAEVERVLNINRNTISKVINGKQKTAGGFKWIKKQ